MTLTFASLAYAQPSSAKRVTVPGGSRLDVRLTTPSQQLAGLIDVASSSSLTRFSIVVPGGRVLTQENADQLHMWWKAFSYQQLPSELKKVRALLPRLKGTHTFAGIPVSANGTEYAIRIDASKEPAESHIEVAYIGVVSLIGALQRGTSGVRISDLAKLPAGSRRTILIFDLKPSAGETMAQLDVVAQGSCLKIEVELPDGDIETAESVHESGMEWTRTEWPPTSGSDEFSGVRFRAANADDVTIPWRSLSYPVQ